MKKHLKKILVAVLGIVLVVTSILLLPNKQSEVKAESIKVHFKWQGETAHIYYSNVNGDGENVMSWPGIPMKEEGEGWFSYEITNAKSADIIFSVPSKDYQTITLSQETGEWWFDEGTWYAENPDGENSVAQEEQKTVKEQTTGGITPVDYTQTGTVNAAAEGITIHYCSDWSSANVYYWNSLPQDLEVAWPGKNMSKDSNGYFTYTFDGVKKINLLFTNGSQQTEDLTLDKAGEYWYKDGQWTKYDPANAPTPTPVTTPAPFARGDFRDETIYFVMTTRFYDGDESNNAHCWEDATKAKNPDSDMPWRGDFKGLAEKLDYIKALGFSAVWITPVVKNASSYDYHGYHAINHSVVDKRYESDDFTYQDFINVCHEKGIKVVQDIVLNHTCNFGEENLYPLFTRNEDADQSNYDTSMEMGSLGETLLPSNYSSLTPDAQFQARLTAMKEDFTDTNRIYHHEKSLSWETYTEQTGQMAGDCVDINTENPTVTKYLRECYINYMKMGVDAFRIDTIKHISRLSFNNEFLPQFKQAGGENFYMFGEACVRINGSPWNKGIPALSVPFYTWKESKTYPWGDTLTNESSVKQNYEDNSSEGNQPTSDNAFLKGNNYHTPDRSKSSGLDMIDFRMHWQFRDANSAFQGGLDEDQYFNDSTWNVVYVDSHDYAPDGAPENQRFAGSQDTWAENLNLMFTFRGIPCIYYGSEIEFMKSAPIDVGPNQPLSQTGRAYFGDHIEGSVNTTDFAVYSGATGEMQKTLSYPLAKHIQRLNLIRRAVPALRKGQYSTEGVSGGMAYKRRYTDADTDSFVCVAITDGATFSGIPSGTYVELVTGETVNCSGTLTAPASGKGNMRVYVLQTSGAANGKVGEAGTYLK